jgi:hypothetical protein
MTRDELVEFTVRNLQTFTQLARTPGPGDGCEGSRPLGPQDLRTIRAMGLTVYLAAMPGHTTLAGPEELMPLMRSDWELLAQAWDAAGCTSSEGPSGDLT